MSRFGIGDLVVCVDDDPDSYRVPGLEYEAHSLDGLERGRVYTVRGFYDGSSPIHNEMWQRGYVYLEEIVRPELYGLDPLYANGRFRPVKKTDISVFTQMLVSPPKQKVHS